MESRIMTNVLAASEAEIGALFHNGQEGAHIRRILKELGREQTQPTRMRQTVRQPMNLPTKWKPGELIYHPSLPTSTPDEDYRSAGGTPLSIDPANYGPFVVSENGVTTIYRIASSDIWHGGCTTSLAPTDLESNEFEFHASDPCIANRKVNGSTHILVDDLKSSRVILTSRFIDHCLLWLNHKYGEHGQVKATRGTSHDYLGMTFDYT
jgi:hypothetical protein